VIRRAGRLGISLAVALFAGMGDLRADGEDVRLLGKVKKAEAGGASFEITAKGGPYAVVLADGARVVRRLAIAFGEVKEGTTLHILGKKNGDSRDPQTNELRPAHLYQVTAIVAGDGFSPPPLPADIAARGVTWITGRLSPRVGYKQPALNGEYLIPAGRDTRAAVVEAAAPDAIVKGKALRVEGTLEPGSKPKRIRATTVILVAPELPADAFRAVIGE